MQYIILKQGVVNSLNNNSLFELFGLDNLTHRIICAFVKINKDLENLGWTE